MLGAEEPATVKPSCLACYRKRKEASVAGTWWDHNYVIHSVALGDLAPSRVYLCHKLPSIHTLLHQYSPTVLWNKLPETETSLDRAILWTHLTFATLANAYPKSLLSDSPEPIFLIRRQCETPPVRKPHRTAFKCLKLQVQSGGNGFSPFCPIFKVNVLLYYLNNSLFMKYCMIIFDYWAEWATILSICDVDTGIYWQLCEQPLLLYGSLWIIFTHFPFWGLLLFLNFSAWNWYN